MTQTHPIGDVLSVLTGRLVARDGMEAVHRLCDQMTGTSNFSHQLPRVATELRPVILAQHPELDAIDIPSWYAVPKEEIRARVDEWLDGIEAEHGATVDLEPVVGYQPVDPMTEMIRMRGGDEGIVVAEVPAPAPMSEPQIVVETTPSVRDAVQDILGQLDRGHPMLADGKLLEDLHPWQRETVHIWALNLESCLAKYVPALLADAKTLAAMADGQQER